MKVRFWLGLVVALCAVAAVCMYFRPVRPCLLDASKTAGTELTGDSIATLKSFGTNAPAVDGDYLIQWLAAKTPHLNPLTSTDYDAFQMQTYLFDSLLDRDPATLDMIPSVATHWEIAPDHLTYTFHLRDDAVFSDGVPLTGKDVKFTFDKLMDPKTDAPSMRNYYKDVTACELLDDYTVRYTCAIPYYLHLVAIGTLWIIPEHIYGAGDFNNHPNNRKPIGSGMYTLEQWDTGDQMIFARNPLYWGKKVSGMPHFEKLIYKIITDRNAAFLELARGSMDMMDQMRAEDWVRRANQPNFNERFNKFVYNMPMYSYLGWNLRKPMFADKRVRQALAMMLDKEKIRREIYYGLAEPMWGSFMPDTPEYNDAIVPLPFDPARAKALLAEAGWKDSDGDGLLDKDGTPFRFEALALNQSAASEKILTVFKEELARAGIELNLRLIEWASLLDAMDKRSFDAALMAWALTPDPDPYQIFHSSQADAGSNYPGFKNAEADQLIDEARVSFDKQERIRLYRRFQEILFDEQPYLFLFTQKSLLAVDKRISNIKLYPFEIRPREWFVPKALQRYGI